MAIVQRTVIQAEADFYFCELCVGSGEYPDSLQLTPILAWVIEFDDDPTLGGYSCTPLTMEGSISAEFTYPWCIRRPDGVFEFPAICVCETEAAALVQFKNLADAIKKKA